jgi:prophage regulatory protein
MSALDRFKTRKTLGVRALACPLPGALCFVSNEAHAAPAGCAPSMHLAHSAKPVTPRDRLLRLPDVETATGCKKSTIYKLMKAGTFPACIRVTARMSAWPESAVLQWVQDRIQQGGK